MSIPDYAAADQKIATKSSWLGTLLTIFQFVYVGTTALALILALLNVVSPSMYTDFEVANGILVLLGLLLFLGLLVIFLIWAYFLHVDLKLLFGRYPITPGATLAQLMIPFYNLWGIWNVFATLGDQLKSKGGELEGFGSDLRFWLPLLYVMTFLSRFVDRIMIIQASHSEGVSSPKLALISVALNMILAFVWLAMTRTIVKAIDCLKQQKEILASAQTAGAN